MNKLFEQRGLKTVSKSKKKKKKGSYKTSKTT